jgi:hypothetical protein
VFDRLEDTSHACGKLTESDLTATDSKLWKIELDVLSHQVRQIGAASINPLLKNEHSREIFPECLPAVGQEKWLDILLMRICRWSECTSRA